LLKIDNDHLKVSQGLEASRKRISSNPNKNYRVSTMPTLVNDIALNRYVGKIVGRKQ
jgi:hypothetical protein